VLLWHVHGSWTTSFVQGRHEYLLPVTPDRGPDGLGLATTWDWPDTVLEVPHNRLRDADVDVVVLQRPHELGLVADWLGRRPGRDVPAVYVEHNTPKGDVPWTRHPLADRIDVPIVHVTHFNSVFWDNGRAPVVVVEHGIVDPGERYTGELARAAVAINEPIRRGRVTGTDLLPAFAAVAPLDVFGMKVTGLSTHLMTRMTLFEDPPQAVMHAQLARRRVYVHPMRWTSLGLSLLEAMQLGMPVVVLGATEAFDAVPAEAGIVSTRVSRLTDAVRRYLNDLPAARLAGKAGRAAALERYGLGRFLADWDRLLMEVTR
jgi:glycosyltransferase involved in cell wall biosynthesis